MGEDARNSLCPGAYIDLPFGGPKLYSQAYMRDLRFKQETNSYKPSVNAHLAA